MTTPSITSLLWFIAIIVMIPLSLWLLKRSPLGGSSGAGAVRIVASTPLSNNQRILTVEVGQGEDRRWLVLGVTPHNITTLHSMAPQETFDAGALPASPVMPFSQLLGRLRSGTTTNTAANTTAKGDTGATRE